MSVGQISRTRHKRRWLRPFLVLALIAAGAGGWYWTQVRSDVTVVPTTVAVTRGDVEETVLAAGILEASRLVSVGAQVSGIVDALHVSLGDTVTAGQLVAEMDRLDQDNALRSSEAALAQLEAQRHAQEATLAQAQTAHERAVGMKDRNVITYVDLEASELALALAEAQLAVIDAQIEQANVTIETSRLNLSRTQITAPIDGTVVAVTVEQGQTLNAQNSAPTVMKIADLDTMLIKAEISEADVTRVAPGQRVFFTIMGDPDNPIEATLTSVEPAPTAIADDDGISGEDAVYYNGIFEVPNPDHRLRIAMTAQVTIVLQDAPDVLVLPAAAVQIGPDGTSSVRVINPATNALETVAVETGLNNDVLVEIISGLSEGDRVVTSADGVANASANQESTGPGGPPGMGFPGF